MNKKFFLLRRLDEISNLELDLIGNRVPRVVIEKAENLLYTLTSLPDDVNLMTGGQGIQFEWDDEEKGSLTIEITENQYNYRIKRNNVSKIKLVNIVGDYIISVRN